MNQLATKKTSLLSEIGRAAQMGTGRILATAGTVAIMTPLLIIALLPISVLMLLVLPPVGVWMAIGSLFSDSAM